MKLIRALGAIAGVADSRRVMRVLANRLDASYATDTGHSSVRVKDLSPTGVYILTRDRWAPDTTISLTLKNWRLEEGSPQPSLRLFARAVRHGKDGVGLAFCYENVDTAAWLNLVRRAESLITFADPLQMLRITGALAFLCRICPPHEAEGLKVIVDELAYESGDRALDILTTAQDLVVRRQSVTRTNVSPALLKWILSEGSRANMEFVRRFWAGLLAATASQQADDETSSRYASLLSKLDAMQIRFLSTSCTRAAITTDEDGQITPQRFVCSLEEMTRIAGTSDSARIEHHLDRLSQLGLLERTSKPDPFAMLSEANLTPTRTGLTLYAMCNGRQQPAKSSETASQAAFVSESHTEFERAPILLTWASAQ